MVCFFGKERRREKKKGKDMCRSFEVERSQGGFVVFSITPTMTKIRHDTPLPLLDRHATFVSIGKEI